MLAEQLRERMHTSGDATLFDRWLKEAVDIDTGYGLRETRFFESASDSGGRDWRNLVDFSIIAWSARMNDKDPGSAIGALPPHYEVLDSTINICRFETLGQNRAT